VPTLLMRRQFLLCRQGDHDKRCRLAGAASLPVEVEAVMAPVANLTQTTNWRSLFKTLYNFKKICLRIERSNIGNNGTNSEGVL
jgi:hypothetical protein